MQEKPEHPSSPRPLPPSGSFPSFLFSNDNNTQSTALRFCAFCQRQVEFVSGKNCPGCGAPFLKAPPNDILLKYARNCTPPDYFDAEHD